jgi:hypothetical protein
LEWLNRFEYEPIKLLLDSGNDAIVYFTNRDLLGNVVGPVTAVWNLRQPQAILKKQLPEGCWKYPGKNEDYYLLSTFKNLLSLVYQYGFDRTNPSVAGACEYLFSCQTDEGDIRGFIGNQYAPYYTGIVMALLINAGYEGDPRVEKALDWLLSMRQNDGGWVIGSPGLLGRPDLKREEINYLTSHREAATMKAFDKTRPFSHSGTGMVIRALVAHPKYRKSPEAMNAAGLLKSHFFKEDNYSSYKHPDNWLRFQFPFWWNNLLAALDSLSLIEIPATDEDVNKALDWFIENQQEDGLWKTSYSSIHKAPPENERTRELRLWIMLAVCRIFKRFYG